MLINYLARKVDVLFHFPPRSQYTWDRTYGRAVYNLMHFAIHAPLLKRIFDLDTVSTQLFLKDLKPFMKLYRYLRMSKPACNKRSLSEHEHTCYRTTPGLLMSLIAWIYSRDHTKNLSSSCMNQYPCAEPRGICYGLLNLYFQFKKRSKNHVFLQLYVGSYICNCSVIWNTCNTAKGVRPCWGPEVQGDPFFFQEAQISL